MRVENNRIIRRREWATALSFDQVALPQSHRRRLALMRGGSPGEPEVERLVSGVIGVRK
jgi:hypothetical protein